MLEGMGDVHRRSVILGATAVAAVLGTMSFLADGSLGDNLAGGSGDIQPSGVDLTYDGPTVAASIRENVLGSVTEPGPRKDVRADVHPGAGPAERRDGGTGPGPVDGEVGPGDLGGNPGEGSTGPGSTGPGSTIKDTVNEVTGGIDETAGGVTETVDETAGGVTETVDETAGGVTETVDNTVDAITDTSGAGDEADGVVDGATDVTDDAVDGVTDTVDDVVDGADEVVDGVSDGLLP